MTNELILLAYNPMAGYGVFRNATNKTQLIEYPYTKSKTIDLEALSAQFWTEVISIKESFLSLEALVAFLKDEYLRAHTKISKVSKEEVKKEAISFKNRIIEMAAQQALKAAALRNFEEATKIVETLKERFPKNEKVKDLSEAVYKFRDYEEYASGNIDYEGITEKISESGTKNIQIVSKPVSTNSNLLDEKQKSLLEAYFHKLNDLHTKSISYKRILNIPTQKVLNQETLGTQLFDHIQFSYYQERSRRIEVGKKGLDYNFVIINGNRLITEFFEESETGLYPTFHVYENNIGINQFFIAIHQYMVDALYEEAKPIELAELVSVSASVGGKNSIPF